MPLKLGAGMIRRTGTTLKRGAFSAAALLAFGLVAAGIASASLAVGPGSTFSTSYIDLPEGALPGGNSGFDRSSLSGNGRYLAFTSDLNSMAPGANPDYANVYRKDRQTGAVELASRTTGAGGTGPAAHSVRPRISGNGNIVAFLTDGALDPADLDGKYDVYVRDLTSKVTTLATPGTTEEIDDFDLSANGLFVVFPTEEKLIPANDPNAESDIYRRNLLSGVMELVSRKNASPDAGTASSFSPSVSGDGRWITFASDEDLLTAVFNDGNGGSTDVFVRDMNTPTNYLVSSSQGVPSTGANGGSRGPSIAGTPVNAADVRVAYSSEATDLSGDDTSTAFSVYQGRATDSNSILISRQSGVAGANANSRAHGPEMSDDGQLVLFSTDATNLTPNADYYGAYLRNLNDNTTSLRSNSTEYAIAADISGDGSRVAWTESGGFTPDSDRASDGVFTRPAAGGAAEFTSRPPGSARVLLPGAANVVPGSGARAISADGRYVVFAATSDRMPGGTGLRQQAYRRDLQTGEIELASRETGNGAPSEFGATNVSISADGSRVSFTAYSPLSPEDADNENDIYMRDFANDTTTLASRADGALGAVADQDAIDSMLSGDGKRVVFSTKATNLGVPGGYEQIYVRDFGSNQTILVSRDAGADPGVHGNADSRNARINGDGTVVVFESTATNLDPADNVNNRDIYVREIAANETTLVSRLEGLAGATTPGPKYYPAISADGKVVAFQATDQTLAPEAGPWPVGAEQIVSRVLATGANSLVSRAPGGAPAETRAEHASVNGDGSVIAFESSASNLKPGLGGDDRSSVFARQTATGELSGPPAFGQFSNNQGSFAPSISDNGQCLAFVASGFNPVSGDLSDLRGGYVNVVSGTCTDPRQNEVVEPPKVKPKLTKVRLTNKKFAVGKKKTAKVSAKKKRKAKGAKRGTKVKFTLNTDASVTIRIEKKAKGRKVKGKCRKVTRKNKAKKKCPRFVKAGKLVRKTGKKGANSVAFSGRIGNKKLKPGRYRVVITAYTKVGASNTVRRPFTIVRK